jgi:RNA polymerase sigma factor for flagellar operon FliA
MGIEVTRDIQGLWENYVREKRSQERDELITIYAPLVRFVVGRLGIPPTGLLEAEDLISYGMIGLINAIDRYDPSRGVRFEAFASVRIRGAVIDQLRSLNWLPRSAISRIRQIESALAGLEQKLGRPAKEEEVAQEIGVPTTRYRQMLLEMNATILSLDAPLSSPAQDDEVTSLSELLEDASSPGPIEHVERQELIQALSTALERLPERERLLLALYYQEELTMKEISKILQVSESRVCQLHMQAVMRLRGALAAFRHVEVLSGKDAAFANARVRKPGNKDVHKKQAGCIMEEEGIAGSPLVNNSPALTPTLALVVDDSAGPAPSSGSSRIVAGRRGSAHRQRS